MTSTGCTGEVRAMPMQSSASEGSYAQNSSIQNNDFHTVAKPALAKAVDDVVTNIARIAPARRHVAIADLGCSYGTNTLGCAEFIVEALQQSWARKGNIRAEEMEIQYFFSDLPSNDFNALFQSLHPNPNSSDGTLLENHRRLPKMYAAGVPGSFHGRLFPSASLDLIVCSYSLHWLSQVPPSIVNKSSTAWNGGCTWIHKASQGVRDAYALQSQMDVKTFLQSRTHELASGGILFLFLMDTTTIQENGCSSSPSTSPIWELFDSAWHKMVDEGIITREEMDMFNLPFYFINQQELECVIRDVPKFKVLHMQTIENIDKLETFSLHKKLEVFTSVLKPTVESHLNKHKSHELFKKLKEMTSEQTSLSTRSCRRFTIASLQCM